MVTFVERLWNISSITVLTLLLPPALLFQSWPGQSYRQHHGFLLLSTLSRAISLFYPLLSLCEFASRFLTGEFMHED
jgi:hypothetical protein